MAEKVDGIKLKPCPFCGGEAKTEEFIKNFGPKLIECSNCGAIVTFDKDEINKWNRRDTLIKENVINETDDLEDNKMNKEKNSGVKEFINVLESDELMSFAGIAELKAGNRIQVTKCVSAENGTPNTIAGYVALWVGTLHGLCQKDVLNIDEAKNLIDLSAKFLELAQIEDMNDKQLNDFIYDAMNCGARISRDLKNK